MKQPERRVFMKRLAPIVMGGVLSALLPGGVTQAAGPLPDDVVVGAIRDKWLALGGPQGLLGRPITPELTTPDGVGRYNHFEHGSIYWTLRTGAQEVHGWIRHRWAELGWERSWLGYPVSDEVAFAEEGRVSAFEHGQIYWWPDTGAIDLNEVVVHYTGLMYFDEMDWDQSSNSDEPYAVIGVGSPIGNWTTSTRIYDDVDRGESRPDLLEVYRGKPHGMTLSVLLMEHDEGDPNAYKGEVQGAVTGAFAAANLAIGLIPVAGPFIAAAAGPLLGAIAPKVGDLLNRWFDFGDDKIGQATIALSAKEMVLLATRTPNSWFHGIGFKRETPLISGDGASAKVYFGIVPT